MVKTQKEFDEFLSCLKTENLSYETNFTNPVEIQSYILVKTENDSFVKEYSRAGRMIKYINENGLYDEPFGSYTVYGVPCVSKIYKWDLYDFMRLNADTMLKAPSRAYRVA